jgi:flagellar basal-body rod protein FlgB
MPSGLTGTETYQLLAKALDLRARAQESIAGNLANQDTPGYRARRLEFQDALKGALGADGTLRPASTRPGHFGATGGDAIGKVKGTEQVVRDGAGPDGNTVTPEEEMARMAENAVMFDAAAQIIGAKYRSLKYVIREGR